MIKLDYNFVLNEVIGKNGFEFSELKAFEKKTIDINKKINKKGIGFIQLLDQDLNNIKLKVEPFKNKFDNLVVLGIGGSALGAKAVYKALNIPSKRNLYILDNIDPDFLYNIFKKIDIEKTGFAVISKSGTTTETISQFLIILKQLGKNFKDHLIIITDPEKGGLREFANKFKITSFDIPRSVGGRFSVLSPVGLVPLFFIDVNIDKLIEGAKNASKKCLNEELFENPAYLSGAIQYLSFVKYKKNVSVLFAYSYFLEYFVEWFKQLWAESIGKNDNVGFTPLKAIGVTDQHSLLQLFMDGPNDKIITFLKVRNFNNKFIIPEIENFSYFSYLYNKKLNSIFNYELESVKIALAKKGRINYTIEIDRIDEYNLGELIFFFMIKTIFTGFLFDINPFDQPGVEEGKNFTYGLIGRKGFENKREEFYNFFNRTSNKYVV